ncbi:MAG TPA: GH3 auxin-responsive promoter family protein [Rhodospirillales bacterium]|nr:GH3 auxin-responsive promoter family protein [Rhodospirillales bacterium]
MLDATPLLRLYARARLARLARLDPVETQRRQLLTLVRAARNTRFGRDHGFAGITDVASYQARVPLRRYEQFWDEYWRDDYPVLADCTWPGTIPLFAVTSGTTSGVTKNIPCSLAMNRSNRKSALDILVHHVANRPNSRILAGRSFMLGGSVRLREAAPGIFSGDLSGIAGRDVPFWARLRYFPPRELEAIDDWAEKIERLASASLAADIRSISGTPSWLLLFFERLRQAAGSKDPCLAALYPNLELLIHGGVGFAPFRARFGRLLAGGHAETREVYPASEGFIALADRGPDDGLRLQLDTGLFYEFVPVEALSEALVDVRPPRLWLREVEVGRDYALAVTSCAGLWSYLVGDTVRFVSLDPPRIVVTGRTSYALSAFGEHLIGEEIEDAVSKATRAIGRDVTDFTVGAVVAGGEADGVAGGHLYIVEFDGDPPGEDGLSAFAAALDARLSALNEDYGVHRAGDFGMAPPRIVAVAPGTFAAWMQSRGKLGGQNKVPRVITDDALFRALRSFVDRPPS